MELIEKIRVIAEYNEWVKDAGRSTSDRELYKKGNIFRWLDDMPYQYSLDALHTVAVKVYQELQNIQPTVSDEHEVKNKLSCVLLYSKIERTLIEPKHPTDGYLALVDAVVAGILLINKNQTK